MGGQESEEQGWPDRGGLAEGQVEKEVDRHLEGLGDAGRSFAAMLDPGESEFGYDASFESRRENAGGGHCILNGEVDADAADGGHGVGRISNA